MIAVVDRENVVHIFQGEDQKDEIPCKFLQEGEMITCALEYRNGLLLSGDAGSLGFFYRNDSWFLYLLKNTFKWGDVGWRQVIFIVSIVALELKMESRVSVFLLQSPPSSLF